MSKLTLVSHHLCPYVQRAAIALIEKGVEFERVYVDLAAKPAWFLAQSPLGKTPLLQVGDQTIFESAVICEYLEDAYGTPLHPADPLERARHRGWIEFSSATLADIWGYETAQDAATAAGKAASLRHKFQWLEQSLHQQPYFAGENFSLVDTAFAPTFRYFDVFDSLIDFGIFADVPRVRAWRANLAARPSVREAVTPDYNDRLRTFLRNKNAYILRAANGHTAAAAPPP